MTMTMKSLFTTLLLTCLIGCGTTTKVVTPDPPVGNVPSNATSQKTPFVDGKPVSPDTTWLVLWLFAVGLASVATIKAFKETKTS